MAASRDRTTAVLALLLAASGSGSAQEQACDDIAGRTTGLQATCCPDGIISCPLNIPTTCEAACAQALLGFVGDCKETFGADALTPVIDPVLALCAAASAGDNSDEVGGGAINHFVDGRLEGCTNVAEGQPATQSSTAYGGDAPLAVDGSGLDGTWGSASCTHTTNVGATWWQVDLGHVEDVRAVQLVNRADCCQDRLVGARIIVSQSSDYSATNAQSCGSVTATESSLGGSQDLLIKSCDPNTFGRYVTVSLPDDSYLTLCEVAVYANCQGTAAGAVTDGESHGDACEITLGAGRHSWADAEADCVSQGGHLTSIHSEEEKEAAAALGTQSWIGLNDRGAECGCDGDCFVWSDGTPNDFNAWGGGEPNEWHDGQAHCDGGEAGIGAVGDEDGGEDCAKIRGDNNWAESNCGGEAPYLCRTCHQAGGGRGKPPPPPPARGSCSCDYTFHDGPANWNTAEDTCVAAGGHLASVHSQANADAFHTLVSDHEAGTAWLGFTDSVEEGTFIWADGSSNSDYANWAGGEPNEWGGGDGSNPGGEDCTEAWRGGQDWADTNCGGEKPFICGMPCRAGGGPAGGGH